MPWTFPPERERTKNPWVVTKSNQWSGREQGATICKSKTQIANYKPRLLALRAKSTFLMVQGNSQQSVNLRSRWGVSRTLTVFSFVISFSLKFAEGYHLQLIKFPCFKKFITLPPPAKKLQVALPWGLNGLVSKVFVLIILIKNLPVRNLHWQCGWLPILSTGVLP